MNIKNIVLDLDNTLILAEAVTEFPFDDPDVKEKAMLFNFYDMDGYYIVFERPGLQEFLDFLFENFNVSVWTAATKDYALFIVDKILLKKPDRKLDWIMFSHHCDLSEKKYNDDHKNLRLMYEEFDFPGFEKDNTIIIDDLKEVYESQPRNAIRIKPFKFFTSNSEGDSELKKLQDYLSQHTIKK